MQKSTLCPPPHTAMPNHTRKKRTLLVKAATGLGSIWVKGIAQDGESADIEPDFGLFHLFLLLFRRSKGKTHPRDHKRENTGMLEAMHK